MRRTALTAAAVALFSASVLRAEGPELPALRFGMETRAAPMCFVRGLDYSKEDRHKAPAITLAQLALASGFEVEIMRALAHRLGVRPVIEPISWFDVESGLLANRFDVILASWTASETTPPEIVPTDPYVHWGLIISTRSADARVHGIPDLAGLRVGHFADPVVARAIKQMGTGLDLELEPADDGGVLFEWLRSGRVDALVFDSPESRWRVKHDPAFRIVGEPLNRLGYHLGVRASDPTLLERLNDAIRELVGSSEMAAIRKRWDIVD